VAKKYKTRTEQHKENKHILAQNPTEPTLSSHTPHFPPFGFITLPQGLRPVLCQQAKNSTKKIFKINLIQYNYTFSK